MTRGLLGRQKMHYNGQPELLSSPGRGRWGRECHINWKFQCSFVFLQTQMKPKGELAQSPCKCQREVWAWVVCDPGSSVLGTGPLPAHFCQGQQANGSARTVLSDILPCLQSGSLRTFRLNPLSIWFCDGRTKHRNMQLSNNRLGITSKECGGFYGCVVSHKQTMSWDSSRFVKDLVQFW